MSSEPHIPDDGAPTAPCCRRHGTTMQPVIFTYRGKVAWVQWECQTPPAPASHPRSRCFEVVRMYIMDSDHINGRAKRCQPVPE